MSKDNAAEIKKSVSNLTEKGAEQAIKAGKDWVGYIQNHPGQSLLFGGVALLAAKGLLSCLSVACSQTK